MTSVLHFMFLKGFQKLLYILHVWQIWICLYLDVLKWKSWGQCAALRWQRQTEKAYNDRQLAWVSLWWQELKKGVIFLTVYTPWHIIIIAVYSIKWDQFKSKNVIIGRLEFCWSAINNWQHSRKIKKGKEV